MKTMERTHQEVQAPAVTDRHSSTGRRYGAIVLVAVLALLLGAVGGWVARGSDGGSDSAIVLAGDGELTARQEQMVAIVEDNMDAWRRRDGDAVAAMYTDDGVGTYLGITHRVDDGGLQAYVGLGSWTSLEWIRPMLVNDNMLLSFHGYRGHTYTNVFEFTTEGEPMIVSHTIIG